MAPIVIINMAGGAPRALHPNVIQRNSRWRGCRDDEGDPRNEPGQGRDAGVRRSLPRSPETQAHGRPPPAVARGVALPQADASYRKDGFERNSAFSRDFRFSCLSHDQLAAEDALAYIQAHDDAVICLNLLACSSGSATGRAWRPGRAARGRRGHRVGGPARAPPPRAAAGRDRPGGRRRAGARRTRRADQHQAAVRRRARRVGHTLRRVLHHLLVRAVADAVQLPARLCQRAVASVPQRRPGLPRRGRRLPAHAARRRRDEVHVQRRRSGSTRPSPRRTRCCARTPSTRTASRAIRSRCRRRH